MEQISAFLVFTDRLERAGIKYMTTGSVASMLYGIPRFTHDLDLVIELHARQAHLFASTFPLDRFYVPPHEVICIESKRSQRGHFIIIHHETGLKADIYVHGHDPLQTWGPSNKKRIEIPGGKGLWVAPPEYVIVRKLEYYREGQAQKHLHDIAGMLEVSGDLIDVTIVERWVEQLDLHRQWHEIVDLNP